MSKTIALLTFAALTAIVSPLTARQTRQPNLVLMSVSAHPDDEDGGTIAYYSHTKGVKTYTLFLTRGEGGQNEIGPQLYEELGDIRTKETLEAARILGSESYFLGFPDFGYSRTAVETFAKWGGQDSVVAHMVYFIRALKPDVIITTHDTVTTKPFRQHGNHQATGISIVEAFTKAADPSYHPEQLHGNVTPWRAKRLFFRFAARDSLSPKGRLVTLDFRGTRHDMTIDSLALAALRKHHSQGMGNWTLDSIPQYYRLHKYYVERGIPLTRDESADLFEGISPEKRTTPPIASYRNVELNQPASRRASDVHVALRPNIGIGIVESYDNTITSLFDSLGVPYALLDSARFASASLRDYSVLILDLRAYRYRNDLARSNARILDYAAAGGNVICFYHKTGDWNGYNFSPYPIALTNDRVTDEDARVTILEPMHPFFTTPNIITDADWDGWFQERSIYLPSNDTSRTSANYERLLAMSDPGENQPPTALLWSRLGKGTYTYCSLALYRQLRFRHEGAMKLFYNMLSQ